MIKVIDAADELIAIGAKQEDEQDVVGAAVGLIQALETYKQTVDKEEDTRAFH